MPQKQRILLIVGCIIFLAALGLWTTSNGVLAELSQCSQINTGGNIAITGGCIVKTLPEQIGTGHGDEYTPGSAVYLIRRDPARAIRRGRQIFQRKFSAAEGQGPRVNFTSTGDITENRALGAGLTDSCAACHGRPRGAAGFGGDVATFPESRDAPHLFGLGLQEMLADEMTADLRAIRQQAVDDAVASGTPVTHPLIAKGIHFGAITAHPDGSVDTSAVDGVNADLRIRPFFSHGATVSMREFAIGAFKAEMGLEAWDPILCAVTDTNNPVAMTSPSGFVYDPAQDTYERPPVCDAITDGDNDGVVNEIDPAIIDYMEFYLLNYFRPGVYEQTVHTTKGLQLMTRIGCTSCHTPSLTINQDRRVADVNTVYDPVNGIYNDLFATASTRFWVFDDGQPYPQLLPEGQPFVVENFFSDLKRHDLGPMFHERDWDGSLITEHVTEPLWGVGTTAPYGHDGRSINLDAVIRRHGGEAEAVRLAYERLSWSQQEAIIRFLQTLVIFPPDDTASNLNPGDPNGDPQDPIARGTINLGALFQISEEGGE